MRKSVTQDVIFEVKGPIGLITLNRPKALNALTLEMILEIGRQLREWAANSAVSAVVIRGAGDRAFCSGGDIRAIWEDGKAMREGRGEGRIARNFFREEYRLNRQIKVFPKPYIALIDGITMGGGVGVSVHGSHRVTTERTLFAMPEAGIGLFPDVGATYFLPRMPGYTGRYIGLTGARLQAGDLHYLGIGTGHVPSDKLDALVEDFAKADWSTDADPYKLADDITAGHEIKVDPPILAQHRELIDRAFQHERVEEVFADLEADGSEFAAAAIKSMRGLSPTSLKVTLAQLHKGVELSFDDAMRLEFRITRALLNDHDVYEGIRAAVIDKDRSPKWSPASLEGVSEADVDRHFAELGDDELTFED